MRPPVGGDRKVEPIHRKMTVAGTQLDSVIQHLRSDVASSGDATLEIEWRIGGA
jgi:hypothetical protein